MRPFLTLQSPRQAREWYEKGLWKADNFYGLAVRNAQSNPDGFAARDSQRRLTWGQLVAWADAIAAGFHEKGLLAGDVISLWMSNRVEAIAVMLACSRNGYVLNPSLHKGFTVETVYGLLKKFSTRLFIGEDTQINLQALQNAGVASVTDVLLLPPDREVCNLLSSQMSSGDAHLPQPLPDPDRVFHLSLTSGTTGAPKGVMHSENTFLANARDLVADWGHDGSTILCGLSPLSHNMFWIAVAQVMVCGGEVVVNDLPPGKTLLDWIMETGSTYAMGVPTHVADILAEQKRRGISDMNRVKVFYMAGSPIPRVFAEGLLAQGITPQNVYGMSENLSHQYTRPDDDLETIVATVGRPGASYNIRIFKTENPDLPAAVGEVGQIGGRGACLMLGYFGDQAATEASFNKDGWFMSGDLGVTDAQGNLKIVGRIKDIIIRGGHNIHPAVIEELALRHGAIDRATAFGVPDGRLGERICLAVSIQTGQALPPADIIRYLKSQGLSKSYMPEYITEVADMPMNASGKILKRELMEMCRSGHLKLQVIDKDMLSS